jgi:hypothetical protein
LNNNSSKNLLQSNAHNSKMALTGLWICLLIVFGIMLIISGSIFGSNPERKKGYCMVTEQTEQNKTCCSTNCGGCSNCGSNPSCDSLRKNNQSGSCCSSSSCCASQICTTVNKVTTCRCSLYVTQACSVSCNPCKEFAMNFWVFSDKGKYLAEISRTRDCPTSNQNCINIYLDKYAVGENVTCYYQPGDPSKDVVFNTKQIELRKSWMISTIFFGSAMGFVGLLWISISLWTKYNTKKVGPVYGMD